MTTTWMWVATGLVWIGLVLTFLTLGLIRKSLAELRRAKGL